MNRKALKAVVFTEAGEMLASDDEQERGSRLLLLDEGSNLARPVGRTRHEA